MPRWLAKHRLLPDKLTRGPSKIKQSNYVDHWQEWIAPTLVAGITLLVAIFCCWFPYLIVVGPVTCGMYCCAVKAVRGGAIEVADLKHGWRRPGRSIVAALVIYVGWALPLILFYGLALGCMAALLTLVPEPQGKPNEMTPPEQREVVKTGSHANLPSSQPSRDEEEKPAQDAPQPRSQLPDELSPRPDARDSGRRDEPSPGAVFALIAGMCFFYALMFLAIVATWLWMLWFGTRTMFVFPLIADRRYSFGMAWRESWRETRTRFWELLIVQAVAGVIGMLGIYAMYVGLIFTIPIMFSIIVAVYVERFPASEASESKAGVDVSEGNDRAIEGERHDEKL